MSEVEAAIKSAENTDAWKKTYRTSYQLVGKVFHDQVAAGFKSVYPSELRANNWAQYVNQYVLKYAGTRIRLVDATTLSLLRPAIAEGIAAGEGIPDISKRIEGVYDYMAPFRSDRISRTEVISASNLGSRSAALDTGLDDLYHTWLSTRDDRTRDIHAGVDGQKQALADTFTVGGEELLFPGDYSRGASAENLVNCRCTEYYSRI